MSGDSVRMAAPTHASAHAVMFTVSWNCRNLQMLSYTHRPGGKALVSGFGGKSSVSGFGVRVDELECRV